MARAGPRSGRRTAQSARSEGLHGAAAVVPSAPNHHRRRRYVWFFGSRYRLCAARQRPDVGVGRRRGSRPAGLSFCCARWLRWGIPNSGVPAPESTLLRLLNTSRLPRRQGRTWMAGAASVARAVRNHFLIDRRMPAKHIYSVGYWKRGAQDQRDMAAWRHGGGLAGPYRSCASLPAPRRRVIPGSWPAARPAVMGSGCG